MSTDEALRALEAERVMVEALQDAGFTDEEIRTETASGGDGFTAAVEVTTDRDLLGTSGTGNGFTGGNGDDD